MECFRQLADGKTDRVGGLAEFIAGEGKDQSRTERITAAETVHDIADFIRGVITVCIERSEKRGSGSFFVQHTAPVVVIGGTAFAQRNGDQRAFREAFAEFAGDIAITVDVDFSAFHGSPFRRDAKYIGSIFLIADDEIGVRNDLFHAFLRQSFRCGSRFPVPEFFPEIEIAGNADSVPGSEFGDGKR